MSKKAVSHYDLHWELWNWLSENPLKSKSDWPMWKNKAVRSLGFVVNDYFACNVSYNEDSLLDCRKCPLDNTPKDDSMGGYGCLGGLYREWERCKRLYKKAELARKIRDLSLFNGWKEI